MLSSWSLLVGNYQEARAALNEVGIDCAMITLNGAQVFDKEGNSLFTVLIPNNQAISVLDILDANGIYYEVATNDGLYSENQSETNRKFCFHGGYHLPHLTYKMAIAMASAKLELLHIIRGQYSCYLGKKKSGSFKNYLFYTEGPAVLGPVGKQISL